MVRSHRVALEDIELSIEPIREDDIHTARLSQNGVAASLRFVPQPGGKAAAGLKHTKNCHLCLLSPCRIDTKLDELLSVAFLQPELANQIDRAGSIAYIRARKSVGGDEQQKECCKPAD